MSKKHISLILVSVIVLFGYLFLYPKFIKKTSSTYYKVINDIRYLGKVIDQYNKLNGKFPTTAEGLDILTKKTGMDSRQYVNGIPVDSWANQYHYLFPGTHNPDTYDLWSYGADNLPGGKDENSDIGNWMGLEYFRGSITMRKRITITTTLGIMILPLDVTYNLIRQA